MIMGHQVEDSSQRGDRAEGGELRFKEAEMGRVSDQCLPL